MKPINKLFLTAMLMCGGSVTLAAQTTSVSNIRHPPGEMATAPSEQKKTCEDTFTMHKDEIERLILNGNKAGVGVIFDKAGCAGIAVNVNDQQGQQKSRIKVSCSPSFPPPTLNCTITFGAKLIGPNPNKQ